MCAAAAKRSRILARGLDRLFAALSNGPSLNCRPHSSRQRIDFVQLAQLKDAPSEELLRKLLGPERSVTITPRVPAPPRMGATSRRKGKERQEAAEPPPDETPLTPEESAAWEAWKAQQKVLTKLRVLADEARTYEQDTGAYVLN